MANLIIDIGNTVLKAAWADGVTLGKTFRYQGENYIDFILSLTEKSRPDTMVVSTVRPLSAENREMFARECGKLVIMSLSDTEIVRQADLPEYLTPDRAASIIAVRHIFKGRGCTIFDFGNTLTIDFLDADGHFKGGNLSPGCVTRFRAVNRYSKSLPLLEVPEDFPETGYSIESSIYAGIISGIMFEIEGYISRYPENIVVFTGGDAIYFAKRMKNSIFVVCNLVLMGLALTAVRYGN